MCLTRDSGVVLGGSSYSGISGEKTQNSRGQQDYWVVKLNSLNQVQWNKTIGGNGGDYLESVFPTTDGGYILGGYSLSTISGEKTENGNGDADYWIVKLNAAGNVQWDKTIGGSKGDYLKTVQQTGDGGYIAGGYSYSDASGDKTENTRGNSAADYWIVKLNSKGNVLWDKTVGGDAADYFNALQQTSDGGYILGGSSYSGISGEKTGSNRGFAFTDFWVIKLDAAGNIQWDKTIGGSTNDNLTALQQTADGGYILGGSSQSGISGEKTENSRGFTDYWLVKLNKQGNIQWDKTIGGSAGDGLTALQQTRDGGYIAGGISSSGISGEKTQPRRGYNDYWVINLNGNGSLQWDKTLGGIGVDELHSVKEVGRNRYIVGGTSLSGMSVDKTEPSRGYADYWMVRLNYNPPAIATVAEAQHNYTLNDNSQSFSIFPNPAKNILHIQTTGKSTFILTNQSGKVLLTKAITGKGEINIAQLPAGLYYVKNTATGVVQKVVVGK